MLHQMFRRRWRKGLCITVSGWCVFLYYQSIFSSSRTRETTRMPRQTSVWIIHFFSFPASVSYTATFLAIFFASSFTCSSSWLHCSSFEIGLATLSFSSFRQSKAFCLPKPEEHQTSLPKRGGREFLATFCSLIHLFRVQKFSASSSWTWLWFLLPNISEAL